MLLKNGVTILDRSMNPNTIRILKHGVKEVLGFHIVNETGQHLFIEPEFYLNRVSKLIIRTEPK